MHNTTYHEFFTILKNLLVDAFYPDYVHIPGLGIRMKYSSFVSFSEDLYKNFNENGEAGLVLFFEKLKSRPDINFAVTNTKKLIYSHLDTIGIKDENEKQKYISGIIDSIENSEK
ncbi:MAG: hypothetical protein EHM58_00425 [Ignavibacteriae bacterium]|nr:MAG: hypothetical protein EHM58_00425 [Ignavibacteriota bacterium]